MYLMCFILTLFTRVLLTEAYENLPAFFFFFGCHRQNFFSCALPWPI